MPCFLADGMLGRLAKWLRLLGYDTVYDQTATDAELARHARAKGRVLLTRDRELVGRRGLRAVLIRSNELTEQVREVQQALALPRGEGWPTALEPRCSVCNAPLKALTPGQAADRVPPYVMRTQRAFFRCVRCGRIYWNGTHATAMRAQAARFEAKESDGE